MAAIADAVTEVPDTHEIVHGFAGGRNARGQRVGIVDGDDRHIDAAGFERGAEVVRHVQTLQLSEIGRFENDSAADDAGKACSHAFDGALASELADLAAHDGDHVAGGNGLEIEMRLPGRGIHSHITQFGTLHDSRPQMPGGQHSDAPSHQPS